MLIAVIVGWSAPFFAVGRRLLSSATTEVAVSGLGDATSLLWVKRGGLYCFLDVFD
jgi:hypothetical protein